MSVEKNLMICSYDILYNNTHKLSSVYKYFQQVAGEDLDTIGLSYEALLEKGIVFVLAKMKSVFYQPLQKNDMLCLKTCQRRIKGATFIRDYVLLKDGNKVAESSSYWALMDIDTRRLCRPSALGVDTSEPTELCSFEIDERFSFPDTDRIGNYTYSVAFCDIDENKHMNNTRYPDICLDAIGGIDEDTYVSEVLIDYLAESKIGEKLDIKYNVNSIDGEYYFSAVNLTTEKKCFDTKIKLSKK